ncbi:MAG: diguanylate cyclase, partial [Gammaproteobacteria bacterium]
GIAMLSRKMEIFPNIEKSKRISPEIKKIILRENVKSLLVIPLYYQNEALGAITIGFTYNSEFPDDEKELFQTIGTSISLALANARQFERLESLATYDNLTDLPNRNALNQDCLIAIKENSNKKDCLGLILIDLDRFKEINDTLGHDVGDELLKKVAIRIKRSVREEDTVARIGGDEFTVILSALKDDIDASKVAQKIVEAVRPPFNVCGNEIFITISIGIAVGDTQNSDGKLLTKQADTALYRAKNLGRNTFQFFTPELDAKAKDKLFISNSLHRALDANEFELYYQPQVDVKGDMIVGFEALLRWHHPTSGELEPDRFIPLLEETGLINPVGRWIFNTASNQMKLWLDDGLVSPESTMSVNLSVHQMRDNEFPLFVASAIKSLDLAAKHLIIEITETSLMADNPRILTFLQALQQLGIKISMDDFGTGYSSLSYLKKFPIDHLKIDRSFIADILDDPSDASIVQAIIAMARSLGLTIIAEGVDAQDKLKILRNLGCDIYQGYFYSKPLPAKEIEDRFLIPQQKLALSPHNSNIYRTGKSSNSKLH